MYSRENDFTGWNGSSYVEHELLVVRLQNSHLFYVRIQIVKHLNYEQEQNLDLYVFYLSSNRSAIRSFYYFRK